MNNLVVMWNLLLNFKKKQKIFTDDFSQFQGNCSKMVDNYPCDLKICKMSEFEGLGVFYELCAVW